MTTDHEFAVVASTTDVQKVFVAIELSKSTWVVAIQPPAVDKVSLFRIAGGEIERLFELFEQARRRAGQPIEICACYEAGYDGFWIYRALTARGVACTVLDSASTKLGLVREIEAKPGAPIWRRDDAGQGYALKLTAAGLKVIAVDEGSPDAIEPGDQPQAKDGASPDEGGHRVRVAAPRDGSKLALVIDLRRS